MDPLSVTATILGLIGAAAKVINALDKVWDLGHAPVEVATLMNEVTDLRAVLDIVHEALVNFQSTSSILAQRRVEALGSLVREATSDILELDALLQSILVPTPSLSAIYRPLPVQIHWVKHKKQILRLRKRIRECRVNIHTALTALNTIQHLDNNSFLLALQEAVILKGSSLEDTKSVTIQGTESLAQKLYKFSFVSSDQGGSTHASQLLPPRVTAPPTSLVHQGRNTSYQSTAVEYLRIRSYRVKGTCARSCICQCHSTTKLKSPTWLRCVLGSLFCNYTCTPSTDMKPCDFHKCNRRGSSSLELSYVFPTWLVAKAISITMLWSSFAGTVTSMAIHVTNVIPLSSPIFGDIITGSDQRVLETISRGLASPFDVDPHGRSLLHWAMDQMQPNISLFLMENGADPLIADSYGRTPMQICWERILMNSQKNTQTIQLKEVCRRYGGKHGDLPFEESMGFGEIHLSVLGFSRKRLEQAIHDEPGLIDTPDNLGRTPLFWASSRGDEDAVRCLLENGADPTIAETREGQTPLHSAAAGGLIDRVQTLLGAADAWIRAFDIHPGPPLSFARVAAEGRTGVMDLLLQHGADINAQNTIHNNTPLHQAILLGIFENVRFLVEHGANIEAQNVNGGTPLDVSIWEHQVKILKYLLSKGSGFMYRTCFGENVLHTLARTRNLEVMRFLSTVHMDGADPQGRNKFGQTPDQLFQSFTSPISPFYNAPTDSQRDAWIELMHSVDHSDGQVQEIDTSDRSSEDDDYVDADESFS